MLLNITGREFAKSLSEKIISLLFPGLNKTFHLLAQTEIVCKSLFKISVVTVGSGPDENKQVILIVPDEDVPVGCQVY